MAPPNFFIIGAPRCGTTALTVYLGRHPEVFTAVQKELHHFGEVLNDPQYKDRATYLAEFADTGDAKAVGEASVWYLYSELAPAQMLEFDPHARVIVMLRNPTDMVYSLHSRLLVNGMEDEPDFRKALALESERRDRERLPDGALPVRPYFYRQVGKYSRHLQRYLEAFGPERVHVIIHDDLRADVEGSYRAVLSFLGVDEKFSFELEVVNEHKTIRSRALYKFLENIPDWAWTLRRLLPRDWSLGTLLKNANTSNVAREPLAEDLRRELNREFAEDVEQTSEFLERDLGHWCADR